MVFDLYIVVHSGCVHSIHAVDNEEYNILLELASGTFSVPVKERTKNQKGAVVKFWQAKGKFTVEGKQLYYDWTIPFVIWLIEVKNHIRLC